MLYDRTKGSVKPFHEDDQSFIFRFFCGDDDPIPREQSMPKGDKLGYVCGCGTRISIIDIGDGPCLHFASVATPHYAAEARR